jgi:hypothetical protein
MMTFRFAAANPDNVQKQTKASTIDLSLIAIGLSGFRGLNYTGTPV